MTEDGRDTRYEIYCGITKCEVKEEKGKRT